MENDENINAGTGSNLTLDGTVECDAAIMDGSTGEFGGGGAVPGVKNPIKLAKAILCHSRQFDGLGRIPPLMLVSSGARSFAMQNGLEMVDPESMISKRAKEDWQKWMERYNDLREGMIPESKALLDAAVQDTVGAVAWDDCGNVAAGVSSGGLLLKNSGRVGEAAIFGAGCWAQQPSNGKTGVACSVSGKSTPGGSCHFFFWLTTQVLVSTSSESAWHVQLETPSISPRTRKEQTYTTYFSAC